MSVTIGNARISEFGTVQGKRGDETGKEVMTQPFSTGGKWEYCIRPKTITSAQKIAHAMVQACANNNIGYSQTDRTSLYELAKKANWNLSKVGKCNCDCSALVAVCVNAAGIKISPYMYTGNELALLRQTGKFTVITGADQCKRGKKLRAGDITLTKTTKKKTTAQIAKEIVAGKGGWGNEPQRSKKLKAAGYSASEIKSIQAKVNKLMKK